MSDKQKDLIAQIRKSFKYEILLNDEELVDRALEKYLAVFKDRAIFYTAKWSKVAKLLKKQNHRCYYCDQPITKKEATLDHKVPVCLGGLSQMDNLVVSCERCNGAKLYRDDEEFIYWLRQSNEPHRVIYQDENTLRKHFKRK